MRRAVAILFSFVPALGLVACSDSSRPTGLNSRFEDPSANAGQAKLLGDQGLDYAAFGRAPAKDDAKGGGLAVNAFLWRGALDTLSFMPLVSADPFGGVIITDWYVPPSTTGERLKATAYILGRQLRSDGIKVSVFRQVLQNGQWIDAPVAAGTSGELEDRILARARELRSQSAGG
jgi:hypothetical protein